MARELGLNPHTFGKLANEKQEPWKKLPEFIEEIYDIEIGYLIEKDRFIPLILFLNLPNSVLQIFLALRPPAASLGRS